MAKGILKNYKSSKLKLFLFFLFVATLFWFLTKFSKDFTSEMTAKINYTNLPETIALSENNIHQITFDLTANGFEILFYKFKKPAIDISIGEYYSKEKDGFTIPKSQFFRMVAAIFNRNLAIKNLSVENLKVNLDPIVLKKVKVIAKTDLSFKNGFKAVDSIIIVPDSVTISGPSGSLKAIKAVETELVSKKDIDNNISEKIAIESPSNEVNTINPKKVTVNLAVAEFSQGQYTLPVEVINLPPNTEIKLIPQTISVSFDMSVIDFPSVTEDGFRIVCDYSKRNTDENFMLPILEKKPKGARNITFRPKKIDFLLVK